MLGIVLCVFVPFSGHEPSQGSVNFMSTVLKHERRRGGKFLARGHSDESLGWTPLNKSDIDNVKTFLVFMGWPRSCHSIIGSMLDAHPNIIVAHEYFLFKQLSQNPELSNRKLLYNELYRNSYMNAKGGWRTSNQTQKGYSISVGGLWQGRFTSLKVIGDKCGGDSTRFYSHSRGQFKKVYWMLKANVKVPIKILQIVRNPFDMIATVTLYRGSGKQDVKVNTTSKHKYTNFHVLNGATRSILDIARAIVRMISDVGLSPLEIHCEDLIADPAKTILEICRFLDVECSADYLQMCVDKTFKNVSESRHLVQWDPQTLPRLMKQIKRFPFFKRYSF